MRKVGAFRREAFADAITPRTKAAIVVDLYGSMPDWDHLAEIARRHGVALIEDAAEAIGSRWKERPAGSFGVMSTFSFHGSKTVTTGEGGMLLVDDDELLARVLKLRDHGRKPGDIMFFNDEVGWKYKMSSMQAALGLAQLERVAELVNGKRQNFSWYREELSDWNQGSLNADIPGLFNSYWMTTVILNSSARPHQGRGGASNAGARNRCAALLLSAEPDSSLPRHSEAARARSRNKVAQR